MAILTSITKKDLIAEGTLAVRFKKPGGFSFKAGQSVDMTLINPPETDAEGNTRAFSIASAPHESELMIATRLRDTAFKRVLRNLPEGSQIQIDGPFGSFTLQSNKERPAVFLMGGIGITPARSIIMQAAHDALPHKIFLFYSNRRPEDAAFLVDLEDAAKANKNFVLVATMTEMEKSKEAWAGEKEIISKEMVARHLPAGTSPIYYLAGPPGMVAAMRKMAEGMGATDDDIRTEEFAGY